jgi:hypothetical protein
MTNEANVFGNGGMEKMKENDELRKRGMFSEMAEGKNERKRGVTKEGNVLGRGGMEKMKENGE